MNFTDTRQYIADILAHISNTQIKEMTVDEITALAEDQRQQMVTLADLATRLMTINETMWEKIHSTPRSALVGMRLLCGSSATVLKADYYKLSQLLVDLQCFEMNRMLCMLGYPEQLRIGADHSLTNRDTLQRIAESTRDDALWDELTGLFKKPVESGAA